MEHRIHVHPWLRRPGGVIFRDWLAITLWRDIFTWRPLTPGELAHELEHVRQWTQHGPLLYPLRYWLSSLRAIRARGHWYRDNAFERAAREAADRERTPPAPP